MIDTLRTRYEPYGYIAAGTPHKIGFTGHVNDIESGLIYMQQRYYDPVAGRFLSIDPVTTDANTGGSFNRYVYASNNPYRYTDPDGRMDSDTCASMGSMNCTNVGGSSGGNLSRTGGAVNLALNATSDQRITPEHCAEETCSIGEKAGAVASGVWSIVGGTGNAIRFLGRGAGIYGADEKQKWTQEGIAVEKFMKRYREDNQFSKQVDDQASKLAGKVYSENHDGWAKSYLAGRAVTGMITGLGPAAFLGGVLHGIESGRGIADALFMGGLLGK